MRNQRHSRPGFTIVEMLVATALVLVIMLIISQAFASASKTFRTVRAAGDMQAQLREGITTQRRDLSADHFGSPYGSARGGPRVSDQRLDQPGWQPPYRGYFEIRQLGDPILGGPTGSILEPLAAPRSQQQDGERLTSTRAINHRMRFTVHLPDAPGTDLFTAQFENQFPGVLANDPNVNAFINGQGILYSRWAEVSYFLVRMNDDASANGIANTRTDGGGLTRYTLRRRVRLLAPQNVDYPNIPVQTALQIIQRCGTQFIDVIPPYIVDPVPDQNGRVTLRMPGPEALNGPDLDWTPRYLNANRQPIAVKRLKFPEEIPDPEAYQPEFSVHPTGDDILMVDVLSMDIKAAWFNNPSFNGLVPGSSPPSTLVMQSGVLVNPGIMANVPAGDFFTGQNMDEPFSDLFPSVLQAGIGANRRFDTGWHKLLVFAPPASGQPWPQDPADWDYTGSFPPVQPTTGFLTPGATTVPTRINVRALQIKLRVWNPRAEQARQVTFIVEV